MLNPPTPFVASRFAPCGSIPPPQRTTLIHNIMNKINRTIWAVLALACFACVITGHYWHIGTFAVCGIMYLAHTDNEDINNQ